MAHTIYPNEVIEHKIEDNLITKLDANQFCTHNDSMTGLDAGMKKKIVTWDYAGDVQEVTMGNGNTNDGITVSFTEKEYEVGTTQGFFSYYDEQEMQNPKVVEVGTKGLTDTFTNDLTKKVFAELGKTVQAVEYETTPSYDSFVDAAVIFGEDQTGLFAICNPKMEGVLRKVMKDSLEKTEAYVRAGYIGAVAGIPIKVTNAASDGEIIVATKEAVTVFTKKGSEVEQERDANIRKNTIYGRKVALVALTDGTKAVKIKKKAANQAAG